MNLRPGRAAVVGTGLIGGSIGLALRARGWHVTGSDVDAEVAKRALALGALDEVGQDDAADITFVCTPVGATAAMAVEALGRTAGIVTDVGGVKAAIVEAVGSPRFVGGHPMAGSEQLGVEGSSADLFEGAVWVLTPAATTDPDAYARLRAVLASFGAEVLALSPRQHDDLVAVVSHVPHLTAASLMRMASGRAQDHHALLRLAAGGFRDMTRVASGSPAIWPDVCLENREAILATFDGLLEALGEVRSLVERGDRAGLLQVLAEAQEGRRNLPGRAVRPAELAEVRTVMPNDVGQIAGVTTLASEIGVNIFDAEMAHSSEGDAGVHIAIVAADAAERFRDALAERGYRSSVRFLSG